MLHHPTLDKLTTLRLTGMHKALKEQLALPEITECSFEERLGLLIDREITEREDRRLQTRLRQARLKHSACLEDLDTRSARGLDKALIRQLATGQWIREGLNLLILGPTGVGKTWIACALLDRLLHHAVVIEIEGSSYRLREHAHLMPEHLQSTDTPSPHRRRGRPRKSEDHRSENG